MNHIVEYQYLTITASSCSNSDGRDGQFLRDRPCNYSSLKRERNHLSQHRNVPLSQLLLQIDRMRANHNFLFLLHTFINSRQQIP